MSRSKHRAKCRHSCKTCTAMRQDAAKHKTSRQTPTEALRDALQSPQNRQVLAELARRGD